MMPCMHSLISRPIPISACNIEKLGMGLGIRLLHAYLLVVLNY